MEPHKADLRHHYDSELEEIRASLVDLGTMALSNIRHAGIVFSENRPEEIETVRNADIPINAKYTELEARVFEILALQQPVASDLRFLVASTRILYELERSGDLAVNVVKALARLDGIPTDASIHSAVSQLAEASAAMFTRGIEAIATLDPEIGMGAELEDEATDHLTASLYKLVTLNQDELGLETAVALFRIGRYFERIADHGVNIAENVTFVVTAQFPGEG